MKQCPRCASELNANDKVCPRCGLPVDKMQYDEEQVVNESKLTAVQKKEKKRIAKEEKKAKKREQKLREQKSDTDFSVYASNAEQSEQTDEVLTHRQKREKIKKAKMTPKFELDENGEFHIDTKDVELVGEETGKIIDEHYAKTYSIKKARGDYHEPKIKWWEIYKLADRAFARRKIKKEVSKASKIKPDFIKKSKLLLLAIFLGWTGAHNFYAKNKTKGWVTLISLLLSVGVMQLAKYSSFFASIQISVGGFFGFVTLVIWFGDAINIMFNNFKYRIQKDAFIFNMNIKTRAKLGEKYIDLDLYQKPWWIRHKVWWQKKRRNYQEWKHDRRQRLIEKEKAKQEAKEKQEKIDAEIAEFEEKELNQIKQKSKEQKMEDVKKQLKETQVLEDIQNFENEDSESEDSSKPKKTSSNRKPKISVNTKNKKNNKK